MSKGNKFTSAIDAVLQSGAHRAVQYLAPNLVVRATRKLQRGAIELIVSICRPNYVERKFVKLCKKAGEKFPLKKIQLKFPPKKRPKKRK